MIPEAQLEDGGHGLIRKSDGWFVLNARDARWRLTEGRSAGTGFSGPELLFDQLGIGLAMLLPGQPMSQYHWETDQEDFLVIAGEATLVAEGEERALRAWDFVHCPPGTRHTIVGAGDRPCWVFCVGSRERHTYLTPRAPARAGPTGGRTSTTLSPPGTVRARARTRPTPRSRTPTGRRRIRRATATAGCLGSRRPLDGLTRPPEPTSGARHQAMSLPAKRGRGFP